MASPQTILDESRCFACATTEQKLLGALVWLNAQILAQLDPMADTTLQTILDESRCFACSASEKQLLAALVYLSDQILISGGGGGAGAVAAEGDNFCFSGAAPNQIFKVKNLTTGLANRVDMEGIDDDQGLVYSAGSAC